MYEDTVSTNFFTDNYVVIILIAVIVLMTIIGYIADKKDFGKKDDSKKVKKNKKNENQEPVDIGQELIAENNEQFAQAEQSDVLAPGEDIIDSFAMPTDLNPTEDQFAVPESINIDSTPVDTVEDVQQPMEVPVEEQSLETPVVESTNEGVNNEPETTDEVVNGEIGNTDETVINEESLVENQEAEPSSEERIGVNDWNVNEPTAEEKEAMELDTNASSDDFKLPNIENLDEQLIDNNDDADVWKF